MRIIFLFLILSTYSSITLSTEDCPDDYAYGGWCAPDEPCAELQACNEWAANESDVSGCYPKDAGGGWSEVYVTPQCEIPPETCGDGQIGSPPLCCLQDEYINYELGQCLAEPVSCPDGGVFNTDENSPQNLSCDKSKECAPPYVSGLNLAGEGGCIPPPEKEDCGHNEIKVDGVCIYTPADTCPDGSPSPEDHICDKPAETEPPPEPPPEPPETPEPITCANNPTAPECQELDCDLNPEQPSCETVINCQEQPFHSACQELDCDLNPTHPSCQTPKTCQDNPDLEICKSYTTGYTGPGIIDSNTTTGYTAVYSLDTTISDVFNTKQEAINNTAALQTLESFKAGIPDAGQCPSFQINLNTGLVNFGSHELAPPCEVWIYIKTFMLLSSVFACRQIIFGG